MDIKLRARLSAYSKVNSVGDGSCNLPNPSEADAGTVLGVNEYGNYSLFPKTSDTQIDDLFENMQKPRPVYKDEIDGLFEDSSDPVVVTKDKIDTLFTDEVEIKSEEIKANRIVSHSEIDSLFNK